LTSAAGGGDRDVLIEELEALLSESAESVRNREQRLRAELEAQPDRPIVLFGAGGLGRRTLSLLRADGRDAAAFIDNDRGRWGSEVEGVPILSPDDAAARYAADGLAVVTIWRAEGGHDFLATRDGLRRAGWRRVESFIPLFWALGGEALPYITIDAPSRVLAAREEVRAAATLWSDERSLHEYVAQIRWRLTGDFASLTPAEPDQYFAHGVVRVGPDEVFVDCGAFTGDTMLDVASRVDSWRAYHAFEPDPASYDALRAAAASLPEALAERVHLHKAATSDRAGTAHFSATGLGSASLSSTGTFEVTLAAVDDVVTDPPPTFIKMDIEGAESAALNGAARGIREGQPVLAIAAYHKQADLWELPSQVREMMPAYRLFLRPHVAEGFDTVLYAMPAERAPAT
jgi:FkbM family methyltransferase